MIACPRLKMVRNDFVPGGKHMSFGVRCSGFHAPAMFDRIGADNLYLDQVRRRASRYVTPSPPARGDRIDAIRNDDPAELEIGLG
jgi:hypothetical protein